ncbi:MAG: NADH-quinone oxidoreductase subunit H [Acetobacteraceae bacterium]|nr:NADH-quinone oxidoreductase subunit H [Acetobacteraceae bacterium]
MSILAALLAQGIHIVLMVLTAPTLAGVLAATEARLDGRHGPPVLQVWRDLARLARKRPLLAQSASSMTPFAPVVRLAATTAAAALVPSFTLGMALSPLADLLAIVALLGVARAAAALTAMDAGTAKGGIVAASSMRLALFGEPALLLAVFTLALLAGTSNLDLIVSLQREGMMQPAAASALAAAALVAVTISRSRDAADPELSGGTLAVTGLADAFGVLVWLNLLSALFLPIGIAEAGGGLVAWLVGLAAWLAKLTVLALALAACRRTFGRHRPRATAELLAVAGLLALIAVVFALSSASSA